MSMRSHLVGPNVSGEFGQDHRQEGFASSSAGAGETIGDYKIVLKQRIDKQRSCAESYGGGETSGIADERGVGDFLSVELRQAVNRLLEQVGLSVLYGVVLLVCFDVLKAEVCGIVDDLGPAG